MRGGITLSWDHSFKHAVRKVNGLLDTSPPLTSGKKTGKSATSTQAQSKMSEEGAKYAPSTMLAFDANKLRAKVEDTLVFAAFMSLERGEDLESFFGSHILGSTLPLEECQVDDAGDIDETIDKIPKKRGKDTAVDLHQLHLWLLKMAANLESLSLEDSSYLTQLNIAWLAILVLRPARLGLKPDATPPVVYFILLSHSRRHNSLIPTIMNTTTPTRAKPAADITPTSGPANGRPQLEGDNQLLDCRNRRGQLLVDAMVAKEPMATKRQGPRATAFLKSFGTMGPGLHNKQTTGQQYHTLPSTMRNQATQDQQKMYKRLAPRKLWPTLEGEQSRIDTDEAERRQRRHWPSWAKHLGAAMTDEEKREVLRSRFVELLLADVDKESR
ncbi:hypothetical protein C8R46DRAFT_1028321 [Mycena filopes]|nr:hypothetical protein C8R46DRAFT_1028321 [Mycena filopes]